MSQVIRFYISIFSLCILLTIAACSPVENRPGQYTSEPKIIHEKFITGDAVPLAIRSWFPENIPVRAIIIALHGFNDYSNAFNSTGSYLSRQGIACYAYDQRGFGNAPGQGFWAGSAVYAHDLSSFVKVVRKQHPGIPLYVLGESMGGAVTIVTMTGNNAPDVDGVILVAPAVWGRETMPWYQRWLLAVASRTFPWMKLTGKGLHIKPSDNIDMLRALGRDPLVIKATRVDTLYGLTNLMDKALSQAENLRVPALVLYGKNDEVIPKEPTLRALNKMPSTTRKAFYTSGYHMLLRDLQAEKPLADIASWITDRNKPLPFGVATW